MYLVSRRSLLVAGRLLFAICGSLFVVCCQMAAESCFGDCCWRLSGVILVCCLLFVVLFGRWCLLVAGFCDVLVVCYVLLVGCCPRKSSLVYSWLLVIRWWVCVVRGLLLVFGASCWVLVVVCCLFVVGWCSLVVRCLRFVVCCELCAVRCSSFVVVRCFVCRLRGLTSVVYGLVILGC